MGQSTETETTRRSRKADIASPRGMRREIALLALPAIASNISVPLLGLCDTAVAGHLGAPAPLAAIAAGSTILNVIFWLFGFLRMGTVGLTANAYGASNRASLSEVFSRSFFLAAVIGLLLIAFQTPLLRLMLLLVGPPPEVRDLTVTYYRICIYGAPAQLIVMATGGWMVGMQTTVRPMIVAITMNVLNIILSITAVFILKTGFQGIAFGTLTAGWLGAGLSLWLCRGCARGKFPLFVSLRRILDGTGLLRFFRVNSDLFLRSACLTAVTLGMTSFGARLGADTLAANAIGVQFFLFFSFFMDGFSFCGEALCGRFAGAAQHRELSHAIIMLLRITLYTALIFTIIYLTGAHCIIGWLTDQPEVTVTADKLKIWLTLLPLASAGAFIFDGFYVGLTRTRPMLTATLIAGLLFFGGCLIHPDGIHTPDNATIWTAFLLYLLVRGAVLGLYMPHLLKKERLRHAEIC